MSKGNKPILIRLPEEMHKQIDDAIKSNNAHTKDEPYTVSSWIRRAIRERLDKLNRGKKCPPAKTYKCDRCGKERTRGMIAQQWSDLLDGHPHYLCGACERLPRE